MSFEHIVLLFPGQGSYDASILNELRKDWAQVDEVFDAIDLVGREEGAGAVGPIIRSPQPPTLGDLIHTNPDGLQLIIYGAGIVAFEIYQSFGVRPRWLMGHSLGEIAALCCGGAFSVSDGARIVQARNRSLRALDTRDSGMMAIDADAGRARALVRFLDAPQLQIACYNSPRQCVLSGPLQMLDQVKASAERLGISTTLLPVPHSFHNSMLAPAVDMYEENIRGIRQRPLTSPVYSPMYGRCYNDDDDMAGLLARHLVRPVNFIEAVRFVHACGADVFMECGARDILTQLVLRTVPAVSGYAPFTSISTAQTMLRELKSKYGSAKRDPVAITHRAAAAVRAEMDVTIKPETDVTILSPAGAATASGGALHPKEFHTVTMTEIRQIYADSLGYPLEVFEEDADLEADLGIDSITRTQLLVHVFEHFGRPVDTTRISSYGTFGDVVKLVEETLGHHRPGQVTGVA
jgi:acyl transferase domain-containing protein/acyl carrier protein